VQRVLILLVVIAVLAAPGAANAGRTFYGWLYGTEVMPERGAELQTWLGEENKSTGAAETHETSWLLDGLVGVTDQLEVGFPVTVLWTQAEPMPAKTLLESYGVEARYRFVTQDPVDAPQLVPLVRVAVKRLVTERDAVRSEVDAVVSYETGIIHMLADVGFAADLSADTQRYELRPGVGVSMLAVGDLRFGAELYSEINLRNTSTSWVVIGPDLSWTHGRFWLSAVYGVGLVEITNAPRVQWGIAF
jgi:hypothetical protein